MNICFIALKRSGHHAIMNWFLQGHKDNCMFINNIAEKRPFGAQPLNQPQLSLIEIIDQSKKKQLPKSCHVSVTRPGEQIDHLVYNIEDANILTFRDDYKHLIKGVMPDITILCLRDPFNNIASRIQFNIKLKEKAFKIEEILPVWKTQAQEFIRPTDTIKINYNKWCRNFEYRELLAQQLKIENKNEPLTQVGWGGSSFDAMRLNGQGEKMSVDKRYMKFRHDPYYRNLFDKETRDLAKKIFDLDIYTKIL